MQFIIGGAFMSRRTVHAVLVVVLSFFIALEAFAQQLTDDLDPAPPWNINELVKQAARVYGPLNVKAAHVLAWHSQEDNRPFRWDSVLLWIRYVPDYPSEPDQEFWALYDMYQHPLLQANMWRASIVSHISKGEVHFRHPPRNRDVYEFIGKGGWSFQSKNGTRTLASGVRSNTWQSVIGESPTQFYSPEVPVAK